MEFKSEQNLSKSSAPIAIITLDIGNIIETVPIKENDNIEQIAQNITKKFNLTNDAIQFLIENINHQIKINKFRNINKTPSIQSLKMIPEEENTNKSLAEIQYENWQKMIKNKFDNSFCKERKSPSPSPHKINERIRNKKNDSENITSTTNNNLHIVHKKQNDSENIVKISHKDDSNQELSKKNSDKNKILVHQRQYHEERKNLPNQINNTNTFLDQDKPKDKSRSISFNKAALTISEQLYNDGNKKLSHQKNAEKLREEMELQNCSFKPKINGNSKKIINSEKEQQKKRYENSNILVNGNSKTGDSEKSQKVNSKNFLNYEKTLITAKNINIHDKLYTEGLIDEIKKEKWRRERLKQDCPFQPNVDKHLGDEEKLNSGINFEKLIERLLNSKKISDIDLQNLKMKGNDGRDKVSGQKFFHPLIKKDKYYQSAKEKENLQYEEFSKELNI